MKKRAKRLAIIGAVLAIGLMSFMTVGGFADNPQDVAVSARVAPALQVTCADPNIDWGGGNLSPGSVHTADLGFVVNSNKLWAMTVQADHDLTADTYSIDSEDFTYGVTGSAGVNSPQASGTEFSTSSGTNVCGGTTRCARGSGMTVTVTYSLDLGWDVEPTDVIGPYTAEHEYTATQY